jgi:hypothetical protein
LDRKVLTTIEAKFSIVFAQSTAPASSFGFVSLLGLAIDSKGALAVSDFANAIRRYDLSTGSLLDEFSGSYPGYMCNLTFDPKGNLYTPGFNTKTNIGAISRFDSDGNPLAVNLGQFLFRHVPIWKDRSALPMHRFRYLNRV